MFSDDPSTPASSEPADVAAAASYSRSRSDPEPLQHSVNSVRELEAVAELRMGQALTAARPAGTIIPTDRIYFDKNGDYYEDEEFPGQRLHRLQNAGGGGTATSSNNEQTLMDLIIWAIQGIFGLFYPSTGSEEHSEDESPLHAVVLSEEEVDNLAVFQGNIKDFVELQDGHVAPRKIHRMMNLLMDEEHVEWERRCRQLMTPHMLHNYLIREMETHRRKLKAYLGSWNPAVDHCSENIYLLDDQMTAHRIPTVNQTDGVRSKLGVMSGVHAWDMKVTGPIGTHFSVGVATEKSCLWTKEGYVSLIGDDGDSWGWDLVWGNVSHKGRTIRDYPTTIVYQYTPGDIIRLVLDCDIGQVSFAVNEMPFGVAFNNLPKDVPLFPAIGLVYGNMEVSLVYLGVPPKLRN